MNNKRASNQAGSDGLEQRIVDILGLEHPHDDPSDDAWLLYTYSYDGEPLESSNYTDEVFEIMQAIQTEITRAEKAYGGCHDCYGKGYATVNNRWSGHDTDTDIGSPGGYVSGGNANAMKFCRCERGKQLEQLMQDEITRARIAQAKALYGHLVLEESDTSCGKRVMKILNQQIADLQNQRNALDKETV